MMDINLEAGQIVEITTAPSTPPRKYSIPIMGLEKFPTHQEIDQQDIRIRRPVRPIDRQRMRPWLMELLDMGNVFGLRWTNRDLGVFQISWRHASRLGWNLETDGDVFERWARHTGIYKEGDPPEPKRWKANFRCALHSLQDVMELTNAVERRGRDACRTYQFLQSNASHTGKGRSRERRQKIEPKVSRELTSSELMQVLRYDRQPVRQLMQIEVPESTSSDELMSETESESSHQDRVLVQRVDPTTGEVNEEFLLHDHDYSGGSQDKAQRTIVLRQGVGSIVLHKEVLDAPRLLEDANAADTLANLDQLASAAVDSQDSNTITIDANLLSGGSNKSSPSKSTSFEDDGTISLQKLLPRLRARIKETEKAGGILRKRKIFEDDDDDDVELEDKNNLASAHFKIKKGKSEFAASPSSPPSNKRQSSSPQKQTGKGGSKSKRSRKESEGSASDSTEPLMSSCLLLLEAATRLDKAEKKGEGSSERKTGRQGRKTADKSQAGTSKRGRGGRRGYGRKKMVEEPREEIVEESMVIDDVDDSIILDSIGQEGNVVEEKVIYPEDAVQIVYSDQDIPVDQVTGQLLEPEDPDDIEEAAAYEVLRSALENIGSELEISTSSDTTSPKEKSIMRRKKDSDKTHGYHLLTTRGGRISIADSSLAKGLFSGSEIIPGSSNIKKSGKGRVKNYNKKDNVYYLNVKNAKDTNSSIDGSVISEDEIVPGSASAILQGITKEVSRPQIYISTGTNSSGQPIIMPLNSHKVRTISSINADKQKSSASIKQQGGKTYINLGSQVKPVILKTSGSSSKSVVTSSGPSSNNQIGGRSLSSNVKISTLPIISSLKSAGTSIPSSVTIAQQKSNIISSDHKKLYYIQPTAASMSRNAGKAQSKPVKVQVLNRNTSANRHIIGTSGPTSLSESLLKSIQSGRNASLEEVIVKEEPEAEEYELQEITTGDGNSNNPLSDVERIEIFSSKDNESAIINQIVRYSEANSAGETEAYSNTKAGSEAEIIQNEDGSTVIMMQDENGDNIMVNVKQEVSESGDVETYYIPISQQEETMHDGKVRVEFQTEMGNQTCYISPEQLEQANHVIHVSQESAEGQQIQIVTSEALVEGQHGMEGAENEVAEDGETEIQYVIEQYDDGEEDHGDGEHQAAGEETSDATEDEGSNNGSMNIDPRAPLAIREIPLFASGKGESEGTE